MNYFYNQYNVILQWFYLASSIICQTSNSVIVKEQDLEFVIEFFPLFLEIL